MNIDNRVSMLMMSKLMGSVLLGGDNGDILHDGFKSFDYVDLAKCSNINLLTPGKISPGLTGETTAEPTTVSGIGTFTMFNKAFSLDGGNTVTKIGAYSNLSGVVTLKIGLRNSATNYAIVYSQAVSHPGTGWVDFDLTTPFVVPTSGEYYVGQYISWLMSPVVLDQPRAWVSGNATGAVSVSEHPSNNAPAMRVSYSASALMSVVGAPVAHTGAPATASAVVLISGNPTGLTASFSRDGGISWSSSGLSVLFTQVDGSKVCLAGPVNMSSQPPGSSLVWKVEGQNADLLGVALEAA